MKELIKTSIKDKIHTVRGMQIILDRDLAEMYEVDTKRLNEQVKRNIKRFPKEFMFQLTENEKKELVAICDHLNPLKFSTQLPYAFTEQGVAMLSGILRSKKAIEVSINIMNAFVSMRKFISKNAELFMRLDNVDRKLIEYDDNFEKVFDALEVHEPKQGVFFDGQIFDAYKFVSDLIRKAKKRIVLIDNYVDDSVLTLFSKKKDNVEVVIYTKQITKQLKLDIKKFNEQYNNIIVKEFDKSHDRFLFIDDDIYHFGASLKDLGKKWFAFSNFDKEVFNLLNNLNV